MNKEYEFLIQVWKDIQDIANCKLSPVDKCVIVSTLPPDHWPEEVLWPERKSGVLIFGSSQVAMGRDRTIKLIEALEWTELCDSLGSSRRAIRGGGVRVNRKVVNDVNMVLTSANALPNIDAIVLEMGKYNFGIIELC